MSSVTNVILAFGLSSDELEAAVVAKASELAYPDGSQRFVHLNPTDSYGGGKALEVNLAIAAFNHLHTEEWLERMTAHDWSQYDCWFVQVIVQGQHNSGFGSVCIWNDGDWNPGDSYALEWFPEGGAK